MSRSSSSSKSAASSSASLSLIERIFASISAKSAGSLSIEQFSKQVSHYTNEKALLAKKIFLIGDSFRTAMIPALSEVFQEVYVIHRSDYTPEMLETVSPDYVVVEYVERYVGQMKDFYLY